MTTQKIKRNPDAIEFKVTPRGEDNPKTFWLPRIITIPRKALLHMDAMKNENELIRGFDLFVNEAFKSVPEFIELLDDIPFVLASQTVDNWANNKQEIDLNDFVVNEDGEWENLKKPGASSDKN